MNNVSITTKPRTAQHERGDIFRDGNDGDIFVLSALGEQWVAVSIKNGMWWLPIKNSASCATAGLQFIARDTTITIS